MSRATETEHEEPRDFRFLIGLVGGAVVGAGLAMWLGPGVVAGLRRGTARSLERVGAAVDDLTSQGQEVRDGVADAVARGARRVERSAMAAKSHRDGPTATAL